jgi:hypothetical protein
MMQLQLETSDRDAYLATSEVIDFEQAAIRAIATQLSQSASTGRIHELGEAAKENKFIKLAINPGQS